MAKPPRNKGRSGDVVGSLVAPGNKEANDTVTCRACKGKKTYVTSNGNKTCKQCRGKGKVPSRYYI